MILLLTTRLKCSLRLSCKAPSKQPLINFYPAIPMSPGSAATPQQKTPIKTLGESFDVTLADFRSPKEKLWQGEKKKNSDPPLHSSTPLVSSFSLSFSVSHFFFYSGDKSDLSLALSDPVFSVRTSRCIFLLLQEEKPQYPGVWDEAAPRILLPLEGSLMASLACRGPGLLWAEITLFSRHNVGSLGKVPQRTVLPTESIGLLAFPFGSAGGGSSVVLAGRPCQGSMQKL